jgi:hypothetical protein
MFRCYILFYYVKGVRSFGVVKVCDLIKDPVEAGTEVIAFSPLLHINEAGKTTAQ